MKIEDAFTTLRIILAPAVAALIFTGEVTAAVAVYVIAAITDMFDGYFARKHKKKNKNGEVFDSLADFTLIYLAMIALALTKEMTWMIILIVVATILGGYSISIISKKEKKLSIPHLKTAKVFAFFVHPTVIAYIADWRYAGVLLFLVIIAGAITAIDYIVYAIKHKSK